MAKDLSVSDLMDFYSGLLTEKQKEAIELYYNQDFSLAEIAEHMDISRQGVRDFIKRGEKQLEDFEENLGLLKRFSKISKELAKLSDDVESLKRSRLSKADEDLVISMGKIIKTIENEL